MNFHRGTSQQRGGSKEIHVLIDYRLKKEVDRECCFCGFCGESIVCASPFLSSVFGFDRLLSREGTLKGN
jgi:hypothetical protein